MKEFYGYLYSQKRAKSFNICVCYLPPMNSSRQVDAQSFYDCLLTNIYQYQNDGMYFICSDFNSRCGDMLDYIEGVDDIAHRNVQDYNVNKYGHLLIEFLLNSNMCILNGRNYVCNDYTCITSLGYSVVDYCLVNHDELVLYSDFKVSKVTDWS